MIPFKKLISLILASLMTVSLVIISYANSNTEPSKKLEQNLESQPIVITGQDSKSGKIQVDKPTENNDKNKANASIQAITVGVLEIGDLEVSSVNLDLDDWWNPFDGGNQLFGFSETSIWAIDPSEAQYLPNLKMSIKNIFYFNGRQYSSAPLTTKYDKNIWCESPHKTGCKSGDWGTCNGYHYVYWTDGSTIVNRTTEARGTPIK